MSPKKIDKGLGKTPTEEYLSFLAHKSFLSLWAWPNVYISPGKELCDLMVVCGNEIILFSDKEVSWDQEQPLGIAWKRWRRRAIDKSVHQLRGAERSLKRSEVALYLDPKCENPLPLELPPLKEREVHGVAVAWGAEAACSDFFNGDRGSLMVSTRERTEECNSADIETPFTIGDENSGGFFIHVLNGLSLDILMRELDTITDFVSYLKKKEVFVRSGLLGMATGEEDILAYYLTHMENDREHGFPDPDGERWNPGEIVVIDGLYDELIGNEQYKKKKKADEVSYVWDHLIETFVQPMLAGTTIAYGEPFDLQRHEIAVRYMAIEPRLMRRILGRGIMGVLDVSNNQSKTFRGMLPGDDWEKSNTAYAFLTLMLPQKELSGGYEQYRVVRRNMLQLYCKKVLEQHPELKRIIGIATEPLPQTGLEKKGSSEDLIMMEQPEKWTEEMRENLRIECDKFQILHKQASRTRGVGVDEYPE